LSSGITGLKSLFFRETKGDSAPGISPEPDLAVFWANLFTSSVLDHLAFLSFLASKLGVGEGQAVFPDGAVD